MRKAHFNYENQTHVSNNFNIVMTGALTVQAQSALNSNTETEEAEGTLKTFFSAISDFDYQKMRDLTSDDFTLIENGPVSTLDDLTRNIHE